MIMPILLYGPDISYKIPIQKSLRKYCSIKHLLLVLICKKKFDFNLDKRARPITVMIIIDYFILTAITICGILIHCCVRRKRRFKLGRFVFGLDMMDHQSNQSLTERNSMTNFNSQNTISAIECAPLK